jgi:hypothetical protein
MSSRLAAEAGTFSREETAKQKPKNVRFRDYCVHPLKFIHSRLFYYSVNRYISVRILPKDQKLD